MSKEHSRKRRVQVDMSGGSLGSPTSWPLLLLESCLIKPLQNISSLDLFSSNQSCLDLLPNLYFACCCQVTSVMSNSVRPRRQQPIRLPVPGILQERTLEWVAIFFSNAWKWKVKVKVFSRVRHSATPWTTAFQASPSMGLSKQEYWSGVPLCLEFLFSFPLPQASYKPEVETDYLF